ncbi:MAG TPA: hypothetical protein VMT51_06100 [Dongiaceae bacterium]|nr:hypothetical protein [Dongiaceae bacterium]
MNSTEMMRREILRLAFATQRSAFINVRRLAAFYNVPERGVRQELTRLAAENRIRMSVRDQEEFMDSAGETAVRIELVD